MRPVLLGLCLSVLGVQAQAVSRYNPTRMYCAEVQATIDGEGAVILRYQSRRNPSLPLYDRYVSHAGYCSFNEWAAPAYVPSADTASCPVRKCEQIDPLERVEIFRHRN
ncbi:hypothetical protein [Pseudaminobacter sp. NGMCC 1.201702]|uniref:hypothetical protein n=1 Tax=Pseudaminobacter sp. NGMCC 1.201702 TaxID=3391825 RepID=UPI0039F05800